MLSKIQRNFGVNFILKSNIEIELTKEKMTSKQHNDKEILLPYSYIHLNSEEYLNLCT